MASATPKIIIVTITTTITMKGLLYPSHNNKHSMSLANKNRHPDQWNKIEHPDSSSYNYSYLSFEKDGGKHLERGQQFQQMVLGNWMSMCGMILNVDLFQCTKVNNRWIKDHNVPSETLKTPRKDRGHPPTYWCK